MNFARARNRILHVASFVQPVRHGTKYTKKSVFISESNDIFTNLALEDWFYRNHDFSNHKILMLWRNDPCVVIGRHQNPWLEANIAILHMIGKNGVKFARRNSGGGTVYHDQGNLNLTFFTSRDQYNRKANLEIITRAAWREYGLKIEVSAKDDLFINEAKVSGTAAKLGRASAYHHCTLLADVNKNNLSRALRKEKTDITTTATKSVSSAVINLYDVNPTVNVNGLSSAIAWEYLNNTPRNSHDENNFFEMVFPTEEHFPGITELSEKLRDWEWCYGKTPKFSVNKSLFVAPRFCNTGTNDGQIKITLNVEHGIISDVFLDDPEGIFSTLSNIAQVTSGLKGSKYSEDVLNCLIESFQNNSTQRLSSNWQ